MDSDTIWHHTDAQRAALCDVLETLTDEQWQHPSLCGAWTVRDVAAHVALAQITLRQAIWPLLRSAFRADVMVRDTALRSRRTHDEIIATIRGFHGSRRTVPFVTELEPMTDVVVHLQDICLPLGIDHPVPHDAAIAAIERLMEINETRLRLRPPLRGVRLSATDADWTYGAGETVDGELRWLLLLVAGRDVARRHLTGAVAAV